MNATPEDVAAELVAEFQEGRCMALLFDCDGTLAPFAPRPDLARIPRHTRKLLRFLNDHPRIAVGILSGRQLDNLDRMVDSPGLFLVGGNGLEWELGGRRFCHPFAEKARPFLQMLSQRLKSKLGRFEGAWLEEKRFGLTVHYRHVDQERVNALRQLAYATVRRYGDTFRTFEGAMAIEVAPNLRWSKADAVREIVNYCCRTNILVVYAGDGPNDAEAMEATAAMSGMTIGVGSEAPDIAQFCLAGPDELALVLRLFANAPAVLRGWHATAHHGDFRLRSAERN